MPALTQCTSCGRALLGGQPAGLCRDCRARQARLAEALRDTPQLHDLVAATREASSHDQAAATLERVLGPEHPATLAGLHALANMLADQGKPGAALPLYNRVLPVMQRVLGEEHPDSLACAGHMAKTLKAIGDFRGAESLLKAALPRLEALHGHGDVRTLQCVADIASVLDKQRNLAAAIPFAERAHRGFEGSLGVEHHRTMKVRLHLNHLQQDLVKVMAERRAAPERPE